MFENSFHIKSGIIINTTLAFRNSYYDRSAFRTEFSRVETDITQTLYDYSFSVNPRLQSHRFHVFSVAQSLTDTKEQALAGRFCSSVNSTLSEWLSCNTAKRIDIVVLKSCIG